MSELGRRLDALEEIAEEMRFRPYRELAEERGISLDVLTGLFEKAKAETAQLRARGMSDDAIIRLKAERLRVDPAELRREADDLLARFG